jgi:hypothetical protein
MTYWGFADCVEGNGTQRGYFQNEHPNGDREGGTFEAIISTEDAQVSVHGSYEFTGGTGVFVKLRGGGTFTAHLLSQTHVEMAWEGNYDLG